jgi:multiple sugar transport system permease protein
MNSNSMTSNAVRRRPLRRLGKNWQRLLFVLPLLLVLFAMTVYPILSSMRLSLYDYYLTRGGMTFIGIKNFIDATKDQLFINSFWVNIQIIVVGLFFEFTMGLLLALACNSIKRGRGIIVALLTTPILVSISATGWAFRMLMLPEYGPLNYFIGFFTGAGWVNIDWLGSTDWAIWSLVVANIWRFMPFVMLILLAGLSAINQEIYEAGRIDGASSWQLFKHITFPLLKGPMSVAFLLRMIELIKMFDLVYLLTQGGPARVTETASFYIYNVGLRFFRVGYGAALSLILMVIIFAMTAMLLRLTRQQEAME